jgi:hypothetical protein
VSDERSTLAIIQGTRTMGRSSPNFPPLVIRRSAHFDTLVLNEVVYQAGLKIGWHSHELAAFALTLRGSSTEAFRDSRFDRSEGSLLLRPAGERHWDSIGKQGAKCFVLELNAGWIDDLPQIRPVLLRPSFHRLGILTILAQRAYCEMAPGGLGLSDRNPGLGSGNGGTPDPGERAKKDRAASFVVAAGSPAAR